MLDTIVIVNSFITLIMQIIFIYALMERRFSIKKTFIILIPSAAVCFTITALIYIFNGYEYGVRFYLITISLPLYLIFFYLSKYRGFCMLFNIFTSAFLIHVISMPGYFFVKSFDTYIIILFIGRVVTFPLVLLFVVKIFRPLYMQMIEKMKKVWALFCLIPLLAYVMIIHLLAYPVSIFERPQNVIALSISIAIVIVAYGVICVFFHQMSKQFTMQNEQQLLKSQVGALQNQLDTIEEIEERTTILRHDMRHYIQNISVLLQSGDINAAYEFIGKFDDMFEQTKITKYCENKTLNAILNYHIESAKKDGITIKTRLDIPKKIPVDEIELSTVFANAIENAKQACQKLPVGANKLIELVCVSKPHFVLEIANTYSGSVLLDKNGLPISKDAGHGIGTQSIAAFVKKHDAMLDYKTESDMFRVRILLN